MSRDWTPREMYEVEKYNIKNGMGSWWDHMENSAWVINGETIPLCTPEAIAHRREYPCLGRFYEEYDKLYAFLSPLPGGLDFLGRYEIELSEYIKTGKGDKESPLIRWFEGKLDEHFYYRERNDEYLMTHMLDAAAKTLRPDLLSEDCVWFPLNASKCISVWLCPDNSESDKFLMKLEDRAPDGTMGPSFPIMTDDSYVTHNLTEKAIHRTVEEIYEDAGLKNKALDTVDALTDKIMTFFQLKKKGLDDQIRSAAERANGPAAGETEPGIDKPNVR